MNSIKMPFQIRCLLIPLAFLIMAIGTSSVFAENTYRIISTDQLKAMIDSKVAFTLIDARTKDEFDEAHIVKAINIQEKSFESMTVALPTDKNSLLVVYCNGVKCGKSKKVAAKAEAAGYKNIMLYADGFPVWEEKAMPIAAGPDYSKKIETTKLSPHDLRRLVESAKADYVLIDVRDETEYKEGHIPTAINIPVETFAAKSDILPKEKKIIVYCNSGGRSYTAYRKLMKLAYANIYQTIFAEWKDAGMPTER